MAAILVWGRSPLAGRGAGKPSSQYAGLHRSPRRFHHTSDPRWRACGDGGDHRGPPGSLACPALRPRRALPRPGPRRCGPRTARRCGRLSGEFHNRLYERVGPRLRRVARLPGDMADPVVWCRSGSDPGRPPRAAWRPRPLPTLSARSIEGVLVLAVTLAESELLFAVDIPIMYLLVPLMGRARSATAHGACPR